MGFNLKLMWISIFFGIDIGTETERRRSDRSNRFSAHPDSRHSKSPFKKSKFLPFKPLYFTNIFFSSSLFYSSNLKDNQMRISSCMHICNLSSEKTIISIHLLWLWRHIKWFLSASLVLSLWGWLSLLFEFEIGTGHQSLIKVCGWISAWKCLVLWLSN